MILQLQPLRRMGLMIPEETRAVIKKLLYFFILISIILNSPTWIMQIKCYLYGASKIESHYYWLIALNVYALSGGALFWAFAVLLFPKEKVFWLFLGIRSIGDVMTNLSDLSFLDKYDVTIWSIKMILTLTVLTLSIKELKHE